MPQNPQSVEVQMRIRKPVPTVFNAFIDPEITKHFWFTKSSGKLEKAKTVTWTWEMYHVVIDVYVNDIIENEKISIQWGDPKTTVDFEFQNMSDGSTYVVIKNYGFDISGADLLHTIKDATGGFTTVLDGMKAYLEHGINLNLIADKFPAEISNYGNK